MAQADFPLEIGEGSTEVRCYFVRHRNALLTRTQMGEIFVEYYLHLSDIGARPDPPHDSLFKDALSCLILHAASRPWKETIAWTINLQDPLINLFLNASNLTGEIVGNLFSQNVRRYPENRFISQVTRDLGEPSQSILTFEGSSIYEAAELFYMQSEQRLARYFEIADEDIVCVFAQPDCDIPWLRSLTPEQVRAIDESEELNLLERRRFAWRCGCDAAKLISVLGPSLRFNHLELFGGEDFVSVDCPRCGKNYQITKAQLGI